MEIAGRDLINQQMFDWQIDNNFYCLNTAEGGKAVQDMANTISGGCYTCKDGVKKLKTMSVASLKALAKSLQIKGRSTMQKKELIQAIHTKAKQIKRKRNVP